MRSGWFERHGGSVGDGVGSGQRFCRHDGFRGSFVGSEGLGDGVREGDAGFLVGDVIRGTTIPLIPRSA